MGSISPCDKFVMRDRELCRRILGIEAPWQVERVELKLEAGEIHVYLEHDREVGLGLRGSVRLRVPCMITSRNGAGVIWIPASIKPFCTPALRARTARGTV